MKTTDKDVHKLERSLKKGLLYTELHRKMLADFKDQLNGIIQVFQYSEETSYHELMIYANSKAIMDLPEYQINIMLTRYLLIKSTLTLANELRVSRPTLTKYLSMIKQTILKNANAIIESFND